MTVGAVTVSWPFYPSIVLGLFLLTAGYLLAITRWRARFPESAVVSRSRVVAFLAAILCLVIALQTPVDALSDDYLFSVHMVQHLLLTLLAPPLLLYGTPGWLVRPLVRRWPFLAAVGRACTHPIVAFALFNAIFVGYHVPSLYDAVLDSETLHAVFHLAFIVTGVITWWPVLGILPEVPRLPYPAQMLYLFLQTVPEQILGAILTFAGGVLYHRYAVAPRVWAPFTPLDDQQVGGLLMWVGGSTFFLFVFVLVFFRWAALNEAGEHQPAPSRA